MKVRYEPNHKRVIAGGLDCHLKFFALNQDEATKQSNLQVVYKIKVPSEIFAFDVSKDGNHFGMGLNNGSLLLKSKHLLEEVDEKDEEQKFFAQFTGQGDQPKTSKDYKYFYRG